MKMKNIYESLGIPVITDTEELFAISAPVTEPALRVRDHELARSAFKAVAAILHGTGRITSELSESFIKESEQRMTSIEQIEQL